MNQIQVSYTLYLFVAVFSEIFERIGVRNTHVEEIYSLDEEEFTQRQLQTHGLIFLFKWDQSIEPTGTPFPTQQCWFAKQLVTDACATQAIVGIAMNSASLELSEDLVQFKEFTADFSPEVNFIFSKLIVLL